MRTQVRVMEGVGYSLAMGEVALKSIQEGTRRYIFIETKQITSFFCIILGVGYREGYIENFKGPQRHNLIIIQDNLPVNKTENHYLATQFIPMNFMF